ncbi:MAG: aspartyl protease family protein [Steroidobacteraceae bacterium]
MQLVHETPGSLPITDAKANVIRVPVEIDGHRSGAMLDTGASLSTINASFATRFGIRMLRHRAAVGSSTRRSVGIRLGMAKQLQIGNATLKNVVFIVVPDSDLPIPRRLKIGAIIGLPVIMTLGRLEFRNSSAPTLLYDVQRNQTTVHRDTHSNMFLSSLTPYVLVHAAGSSVMLRMELDTGSNSTVFTKNAMTVAPIFFSRAKRYVWHAGGVGGVVKERRALRLPEATLVIGGPSPHYARRR